MIVDHKHNNDLDSNHCCEREDQLNTLTASSSDGQSLENENDHNHHVPSHPLFQLFLPGIISLILLLIAIYLEHSGRFNWFQGGVRMIWYIVAFIPVGAPVLLHAFKEILKGDVFSEFFLMSLATIGAFVIGVYAEGVAVMLFYSVGEAFQMLAVKRAKANISKMLDQRPDQVTIMKDGNGITINAREAKIGETIVLKPGEKLGLDGILSTPKASFNTAALTGESKPDTKYAQDPVLTGMINLDSPAEVKITAVYQDSKLSKILELVQHATTQKAPTELFIRRFAKIYTPFVVFLAIGICVLPYFLVSEYVFNTWLYRALIFLVISCPCALVISIPLGYFGGIGAASKHGILIKGSNFLDILASLRAIVFDKTGTLTKGEFKVQSIHFESQMADNVILSMVNALEFHSTHPIAKAIRNYCSEEKPTFSIDQVKELAGKGLSGFVDGKRLLVGNYKLLDDFNIQYDSSQLDLVNTVVTVAYNDEYLGHIVIADTIKNEAKQALDLLKQEQIHLVLLSGDKSTIVQSTQERLGIDEAHGDLLPEDKLIFFNAIKERYNLVAFVGDGVNDAPVIAASDVGIAMGGLGSDAAIEAADVVIQDDQLTKIPMSINIAKETKKVVWQNILLAFGVKAIVLLLGAGGLATMWEAVFADVGVALLAIINAYRIQLMKFELKPNVL